MRVSLAREMSHRPASVSPRRVARPTLVMATTGWRRHFRVEAYLKAHPDANSEVADVEDLVQAGRAGGPCPYYLSREMAAGADLVLMPYNYLVDARTRFGLKSIQWRGSVLIFDEAHNVEVGGGAHCYIARLSRRP